MRFVAERPKVMILKAKRPPWKRTRTYNRVFALSKTMGSAVMADILTGLQTFKKKIDPQSIYDAWISGDWARVMGVIPWNDLPTDLYPAAETLAGVSVRAGGFTLEALPAPIQAGLRYDTSNPRIANFFSTRTAEMVVGIQTDTAKLIQDTATRSFTETLSPRQVADQIKGSIGLIPQHSMAVENYRRQLVADGTTQTRVDSQVAAYEARLLDYRAMMIARTETRLATNYGQLYVWQEASNQDLIDGRTAKKVWVVDGNPCQICAPMEGKAVGLSEAWLLNNGDIVDVPTESHPHCMCGMELDFGQSREKLEDSTPESYE